MSLREVRSRDDRKKKGLTPGREEETHKARNKEVAEEIKGSKKPKEEHKPKHQVYFGKLCSMLNTLQIIVRRMMVAQETRRGERNERYGERVLIIRTSESDFSTVFPTILMIMTTTMMMMIAKGKEETRQRKRQHAPITTFAPAAVYPLHPSISFFLFFCAKAFDGSAVLSLKQDASR